MKLGFTGNVRHFCINIIIIIILRNLVINLLLSPLSPFLETKNKNQIFNHLEISAPACRHWHQHRHHHSIIKIVFYTV